MPLLLCHFKQKLSHLLEILLAPILSDPLAEVCSPFRV